MTVSRVVNNSDLVNDTTRERVRRAMRDLAYIPNRAARSLVVNKLGVLALVIPDISNPFFPPMVRGAEAAASAAGFTIVLGSSDEDFDKEAAHVRAVCSLGVDGVLVVPSGNRSLENLELLRRHHVPFVLVDREVDGSSSDVVRGESRRAAGQLTEHLVWHGHRHIAMITGPLDVYTGYERELGYREALERLGLGTAPGLVRRTAFSRAGGHRAAVALLSIPERPSGIVAANNFLGVGTLDAARDLGLRVPEDLAVVSFDDVETIAERPFLTCAAQPAEAIGRAAVERLIARLAGDVSPAHQLVFDVALRIRSSCGCNSPAAVETPSDLADGAAG